MPNKTAKKFWEEATKVTQGWAERTTQIERVMDRIAMTDKNRQADQSSIVTNDPATLFYLGVSILSDAEPEDRIHIGNQGDADLNLAGRAERGLKGFWVDRDRDEVWDGGEEWRRAIAFWMCFGYYYVTAWLQPREDGSPRPISDVLSPLETFHKPGSDGMGPSAVVRKYRVSPDEARDHALAVGGTTAPIGQNRVTPVNVVDYWYRIPGTKDTPPEVWYAVLVDGVFGIDFLLEPKNMERSRIPIICGVVGGRPARGYGGNKNVLPIAAGQSLLDLNEPVYDFINEVLTDLRRVADLYARAPYLAVGIGLNVEPDDINPGKSRGVIGKLLHTANPLARLDRTDPGREPFSFERLHNILQRMADRGGLPGALYGALDADPSGFAISQIITNASHKLLPYGNRISFVRGAVGQLWLEEYRDSSFDPILITSGEMSGHAEEWKPSDIPARFLLRSKQPLSLPSDRAESITLARQANPVGNLMSHRNMQETILHGIIEDPNLDAEWMSEDLVTAHPITQALNVWAAMKIRALELREQNKPELAEELENAARAVRESLASTIGPRDQQIRPGVPNSVLPSEQQRQGVSEDSVQAMLGAAQGRRTNR